ncbi:MAG: hypothetical protein K0R44_21 [Thermomicrobiales bacterium]|jgi:hypothetical protein|nr:hypothetical protein [Thermomicrobiales bacterium]MDF3014796.1 hypothetical protein [Thermomicrobiales bacterium]
MRGFEERDELIGRYEIADGWVDFLLHHSWWKWKPWTSCVCVWTHGNPEPEILHRRFWTKHDALDQSRRALFEMTLEAQRAR